MQSYKLSKLEIYLEILRSIDTKKPTKIESIKRRTNLDLNFLNHAVTFLEKQNLLTKRNTNNQPSIRSTLRGERLTRYFMELATGTFFYALPHDTAIHNERNPQ
jgi:predicted transcriptional regulator